MNSFAEMNSFSIAFLVINALALLALPRRLASLPLLVGACYMTLGQGVRIGPFSFTVIRLLIAVGLVRVIVRGERFVERMNSLDLLMVAWAAWALISSLFYRDTFEVLVNRLGLVYNACGVYFLFRIFCQSLEDVFRICRIMGCLLVPLSIGMLFEKITGNNIFSALGGVAQLSELRDGSIRAQGAFSHPILAGTFGAVCLPLMIGLWRKNGRTAVAGIAACCAIVFASLSSGPIMCLLSGVGALFVWHWRHQMRIVRWLAVLGYIGLDLVMKAPAYYIIARIDLTGSSTGWHRAALIDSAIEHLSEWWLAGTNYTRHWMPYGVNWSEAHADITNNYISMGVLGGLPLMLLFIAVMVKGFSSVGQSLRQAASLPSESCFMIWALGASLFAHSIAFVSVSLFDQSVVFFYLILAFIGSVRSITAMHAREEVNRL